MGSRLENILAELLEGRSSVENLSIYANHLKPTILSHIYKYCSNQVEVIKCILVVDESKAKVCDVS